VRWLLETAPKPRWVSRWFLGLIIAVLKNKKNAGSNKRKQGSQNIKYPVLIYNRGSQFVEKVKLTIQKPAGSFVKPGSQ
jgi:hypothetical protein